MSIRKKRFHVVLIKPSKYDEDGYVISWWRGVIVSNTLAAMNALTERATHERAAGPDVDIVTHYYDETVCRIPVKKVAKSVMGEGDQAIICMVGVQSNQFPRAVDLGRQFMREGLRVMIGGFHVSGSIEMLPGIPEEIQEAMDSGITVVCGEVENRWNDLLREAYEGTLKSYYNFVDDKPSLAGVTPPFALQEKLNFFAPSNQSSFDAGRGCPFQCSFCTIINVQGNTMRGRTADDVELLIRRNVAQGVKTFFITDDNFARHPKWEDIADRIIYLREVEKLKIGIMIQTDTLAHRIPRFIEKMAKCGCKRVFIGLETVNPDNLMAASKHQNRLSEYRMMLQEWRKYGVVTIAGYILGFPGDTYQSIMRDIDYLKRELPLEFPEFFIMTPLPGSRDHQQNALKGIPMEKDMNEYDTTRPCVEHPKMSRAELLRAYRDAWKSCYSRRHVERVLMRRKDNRLSMMQLHMVWFRSAILIEGIHPLLAGVFRIKGRKRRSPRFPVESIPVYYARRTWEIVRWVVLMTGLLLETLYLFLKTRYFRDKNYMDRAIRPTVIPKKKAHLSDDRALFASDVENEAKTEEAVEAVV